LLVLFEFIKIARRLPRFVSVMIDTNFDGGSGYDNACLEPKAYNCNTPK
jgi:hypothetical protein